MRQIHFQKQSWDHRFSHGGSLRQKRKGRRERPLSTREPIHLVFKANEDRVAGGLRSPRRFRLIHEISRRYSARFFIKIEMISIQSDHVHAIVRISRRSLFQNFLRVFSGQVAQRFGVAGLLTLTRPEQPRTPRVTDTPSARNASNRKRKKLWKHRPFTRVARGLRAYRTLQRYVRLNELEAEGRITYRKERLKGISTSEWELLTNTIAPLTCHS